MNWHLRAAALFSLLALGLAACTAPETPTDAGGPDGGSPDAGCTATSCDDGLFCNGTEACAHGACVAGTAPCVASQTCDETMNRCVTACDVSRDADHDGVASMDCGGTDCDDSDPTRFPGNTEVCDAASHDEDCDPLTFGARDADGDSWPDASCCNVDPAGTTHCGQDCNDSAPNVHPTLPEVCDGIDNDCDATIDEGVLVTLYRDHDGDLYGDSADSTTAYCMPTGEYTATVGGDCDDNAADRHPGLTELCDGIDQNCDGSIEDIAGADLDGDGYAACSGLPLADADCDDANAAVHPHATEICDGLDSDCVNRIQPPGDCSALLAMCSGLPPDQCAAIMAYCMAGDSAEDHDRDGFGPPGAPCTGGTLPLTDCDDNRAWAAPSMPEWCTALDDNCDGSATDVTGCSIVDIRATDGQTCALRTNGELDCWGPAQGTAIASPVVRLAPGGVVDWDISFATIIGETYDNTHHACIVRTGGQVLCWGDDDHGQLGTGTATIFSPAPVAALVSDATAIATGNDFTCAIRSDRTVACWGSNAMRAIDEAGSGADVLTPLAIAGVSSAVALAAGRDDACAIVEPVAGGARSILCWGASYTGLVTISGADFADVTSLVHGQRGVRGPDSFFAAYGCALQARGGIACWLTSTTTTTIATVTNAVGVSMGYNTACFALATGTVRCFGDGTWGQLGDGSSGTGIVSPSPVDVVGVVDGVGVAAGSFHACELSASGAVSCWGTNDSGRLGDGTTTSHYTPAPVVGL